MAKIRFNKNFMRKEEEALKEIRKIVTTKYGYPRGSFKEDFTIKTDKKNFYADAVIVDENNLFVAYTAAFPFLFDFVAF